MLTRERAKALAIAAASFPFLGEVTPDALVALVRQELGHGEVLDRFVPLGPGKSRAVPLSPILHVVSGNTPHAALQSLLRGLLIGTRNLCKIPTGGLPEVAAFHARLPAPLQNLLDISESLDADWMKAAAVVIGFGGDDSLRTVRSELPAGTPFLAHGHRISLGIIFEDSRFESVDGAARDASLFDQQGCLSPQFLFVTKDLAMGYAERLAGAMAAFQAQSPRSRLSLSEHAAIREVRAETLFRQANGDQTRLWESPGGTDWTVIYDATEAPPSTILNRVITVKPLPPDLESALLPIQPWLSTIGIWPASTLFAERVSTSGCTRICPVGRMQSPPLTWHQDGMASLVPLVRWIDFESPETGRE